MTSTQLAFSTIHEFTHRRNGHGSFGNDFGFYGVTRLIEIIMTIVTYRGNVWSKCHVMANLKFSRKFTQNSQLVNNQNTVIFNKFFIVV